MRNDPIIPDLLQMHVKLLIIAVMCSPYSPHTHTHMLTNSDPRLLVFCAVI